MRKKTELGTVVFRTAIEAEILFAAHVMQTRFLGAVIKPVHPCTGLIARFAQQNALLLRTTDIRVGTEKKTPLEQNSSGKKIGAVWRSGADRRSFEASAVPILVYFYTVMMVHKYRQSAKKARNKNNKSSLPEVFPLTIGSGKTVPFEKRRSRYKETGEKVPQAYRVYVEDTFFPYDAVDARIFSKGEETGVNYYGARYLDPKYSRWISTDPALSEYMAGSSVGAGGIYNTVNFNVYHYGNNNPIKYTDPTGMWIDNGDGTYTAEKGDTLWDKYGADWKEKSGFTRDPRTLQVGETVGEKNIPTYSDASAEMKQQIPQGNAQYSNEQDTPSPLVNSNPDSKGYSRGANIAIGLGEILLGIGFYVGSTITAAGINVATEGIGSYYAGIAILEGYATGSLLFAYGITRLAGSNNQKFQDDMVGTFVPPEVDVANSMNDYSKRRNK